MTCSAHKERIAKWQVLPVSRIPTYSTDDARMNERMNDQLVVIIYLSPLCPLAENRQMKKRMVAYRILVSCNARLNAIQGSQLYSQRKTSNAHLSGSIYIAATMQPCYPTQPFARPGHSLRQSLFAMPNSHVVIVDLCCILCI